MREVHIGELIKQKRKELGITQEELCEGICDPGTLSRIESSKQTPSRSRLNALLQRLGQPSQKFYAMMSENELEIERLKDEIIDRNARHLYTEALEKIEKLCELVEEDDHLTQQFILRSRVLAGKMENGEVLPYSFEEKLELLFAAIRMTVPNFDVEKIGSHWYSRDEVKIINQIGITYSDNGHKQEAAEVFRPLMKFVREKMIKNPDVIATAILVAYNYCLILSQLEQYEEAADVAHWGWDKCVEWSRTGALGGLLFVIGKCLYKTGHVEESKDYLMQSYYAFRSMRNKRDTEAVRKDIKEYYDIDL